VNVGVLVAVDVGVRVGVNVGVGSGVGVPGANVSTICKRKSPALFGSMTIRMLKMLAQLIPLGKPDVGKSTASGPLTLIVRLYVLACPAVSVMVIAMT